MTPAGQHCSGDAGVECRALTDAWLVDVSYGDVTPPDGPILAVRVEDPGEKEAVLAAQPKAFFTIPHFNGYAAVLIQLKAVSKRPLREAIIDGWLACAPAKLGDEYIERATKTR